MSNTHFVNRKYVARSGFDVLLIGWFRGGGHPVYDMKRVLRFHRLDVFIIVFDYCKYIITYSTFFLQHKYRRFSPLAIDLPPYDCSVSPRHPSRGASVLRPYIFFVAGNSRKQRRG